MKVIVSLLNDFNGLLYMPTIVCMYIIHIIYGVCTDDLHNCTQLVKSY